MKKQKQLMAVALVVVAIFLGSNVKAQTQTTTVDPWRLGFGIEGGLPTGFEKQYESNFMLGGTARLQYDLNDKFALTLTSGLYNFYGRSHTNPAPDSLGGPYKYTGPSGRMIPVKLGIKAFLTTNLYFGAEAGAGFQVADGSGVYLILSPALGYASKSWDFSARYESFGDHGTYNFGMAALRVAYGFGL